MVETDEKMDEPHVPDINADLLEKERQK